MTPLITVIAPCYNEEAHVGQFLRNLLEQDYPRHCMEVILVDGNSTDRTQDIIRSYCTEYPFIQLMINPGRFVPFALNMAIRQAKGEVIVRMDVHALYPAHYISTLVGALGKLEADNVGGTWDTVPGNDTRVAEAIAVAMSSPFGVGNAQYRLGVKAVKKVDTVPFGCFPRSVFDRIGLFDEELLRNQDDEFNARILANGGTIYLIPGVVITYFARTSVAKFWSMFYQYALFKPLVNRKLKRPATLRQFAPPLFILFLLTGWIPGLLWLPLVYAYLAITGLYLSLDLLFSFLPALRLKKPLMLLYLPWLYFLQHSAYGIGYIIGTYHFTLIRKNSMTIRSSR